MIDGNELYAKRTLRELEAYINSVISSIHENEEERKNIRLKKGGYKKYREELLPFFNYGKLLFGMDSPLSFQLVRGYPSFDGIISDGPLVKEVVEITFPHFGKQEYQNAKRLVAGGFYGQQFDSSSQEAFINHVKSIATKKAAKDYSNRILVITVDSPGEFSLDFDHDLLALNKLVLTLKGIVYTARKTYLLVLPQSINGINYAGRLHVIK